MNNSQQQQQHTTNKMAVRQRACADLSIVSVLRKSNEGVSCLRSNNVEKSLCMFKEAIDLMEQVTQRQMQNLTNLSVADTQLFMINVTPVAYDCMPVDFHKSMVLNRESGCHLFDRPFMFCPVDNNTASEDVDNTGFVCSSFDKNALLAAITFNIALIYQYKNRVSGECLKYYYYVEPLLLSLQQHHQQLAGSTTTFTLQPTMLALAAINNIAVWQIENGDKFSAQIHLRKLLTHMNNCNSSDINKQSVAGLVIPSDDWQRLAENGVFLVTSEWMASAAA